MKRVLITDILFPTKYSKWRIEECKAFVDTYNADFLIHKIDSYAKIQYGIDYEEMKEYYNLQDYNIIIFDSKFNILNKYNSRIDGTKFNIQNGFSYLFTKHDNFDLDNYDVAYHIFLSMYNRFNTSFKFPAEKQFIHLYPGGGLAHKDNLLKLDKNVNIVSTNHKTTQWLTELKFNNFIECLGSTLLPKQNIINYKNKNTKKITVCFSNMGDVNQKGAPIYKLMAETYKKMYPKDNIEFVAIGNSLPSPVIRQISPMPIKDLDEFYNKNVDILVNAEIGSAYNGWPLGVEAALQGVVLITTDIHGSNKQLNFTKDMLFIVPKNDMKEILKSVKKLYDDRNLLHRMSNNIQKHSNNVFSYNNQQDKIFNFIELGKCTKSLEIYHKFSPPKFTDNTIFKIKNNIIPLISQDNVEIINSDIKTMIFESIKHNKKLSLSRYNDGEWICMLRIPDKNLYNIHKRKWDIKAEELVDKHITPKFKDINYPIGISGEVIKKPEIVKHIFPYIKDKQIFDGGLFARWQIDGTINEFLELLKGKNVIIVGPDYLVNLKNKLDFTHIVTKNELKLTANTYTHDKNFKDRCAIVYQHDELYENLCKLITDRCIVLYSAAFLSKKFINDFNHLDIIQIDTGAAFDNMCGLKTRPWHC